MLVALGICGALLALAATVQAVRQGVTRGEWHGLIPIVVVLAALALILAASELSTGQ